MHSWAWAWAARRRGLLGGETRGAWQGQRRGGCGCATAPSGLNRVMGGCGLTLGRGCVGGRARIPRQKAGEYCTGGHTGLAALKMVERVL